MVENLKQKNLTPINFSQGMDMAQQLGAGNAFKFLFDLLTFM